MLPEIVMLIAAYPCPSRFNPQILMRAISLPGTYAISVWRNAELRRMVVGLVAHRFPYPLLRWLWRMYRASFWRVSKVNSF